MFKVLIGVLALLLVLAIIPVAIIAFSAPSSPPAKASMAGPLSRVKFDDVPAPENFQARDGARLQYYTYPASPDKVAVLVIGSVGPGATIHALAKALRDAGVSAYVLDIRGHGGSGPRGDMGYFGQIDEDLADFVTSLGLAKSDEVRTLVGFSAGAGFTILFAGGCGGLFDRYVFLSPYCREHRPCVRTPVAGRTFRFRVSSLSLGSIGRECGCPAEMTVPNARRRQSPRCIDRKSRLHKSSWKLFSGI